jgi:hypothetical protein
MNLGQAIQRSVSLGLAKADVDEIKRVLSEKMKSGGQTERRGLPAVSTPCKKRSVDVLMRPLPALLQSKPSRPRRRRCPLWAPPAAHDAADFGSQVRGGR